MQGQIVSSSPGESYGSCTTDPSCGSSDEDELVRSRVGADAETATAVGDNVGGR